MPKRGDFFRRLITKRKGIGSPLVKDQKEQFRSFEARIGTIWS